MQVRDLTYHYPNQVKLHPKVDFDTWTKTKYYCEANIFGIEENILEYTNVDSGEIIQLQFHYDKIFIHYFSNIDFSDEYKYKNMLFFMNNHHHQNVKELIWGKSTNPNLPIEYDIFACSMNQSTGTSECTSFLNILSSNLCEIPSEMHFDISREMNDSRKKQRRQMNYLTYQLADESADIYDKIRNYLCSSDSGTTQPEEELITRWIKELHAESYRGDEAELWCDLLTEVNFRRSQVYVLLPSQSIFKCDKTDEFDRIAYDQSRVTEIRYSGRIVGR